MPIDQQLNLCSRQYKTWKELALEARDMSDVKKYLEKALFWLELQTAFVALWSIEQAKGDSPEVKRKLIKAKANLSKKLAEYAKKVLKEL